MAKDFDVTAVSEHYSSLAHKYDEFYMYGYWFESTAKLIAQYLDLVPTDRVADIGAGTGGITHNIWKIAKLQTPVLAVEPNPDMLERARGKEGIDALQATGDEFVAQLGPQCKYNKIYFSHCAHHLPNPAATFRAVLEAMPQDGRCLVINYPPNSSELFWKAANELFNSTKISTSDMGKEMTAAGMVVEVHTVPVKYKMTKSCWYRRLRERMFSALEVMTDEQIEEGIAEIESTKLSGVGMDEEFEMTEYHVVAVGRKPN